MQLLFVWSVVVTVGAMADDQSANIQATSVNYIMSGVVRATYHITTRSMPYHIGAYCQEEQHIAT
jgi:hypothetical protein